ncbi:hypothetical protein DN412_31185 [Cupriavidus lacunae]|uniref:Uncharacterized protein n=1 Tax=Cupriavidus lacunae TaxID=2666307 RepID=A0A370NLI3_9BURK|nr:hypothetical protein DN412_31185 [Cupriavidus lacunae]
MTIEAASRIYRATALKNGGRIPAGRNHVILGSFMHGWERIRDAAARSRRVPINHRIVLTSRDF